MESKDFANIDFFTILESELQNRGIVRFRVKGYSMQPMIRNNRDEVQLRKLGDYKPQIGDICLFKFQGRHILHRLKRIKGDVMFMQGDNVLLSEEFCRLNDVVGIVTKIYRDDKEIPPRTFKWDCRIKTHRLYVRFRMLASRIVRRIIK